MYIHAYTHTKSIFSFSCCFRAASRLVSSRLGRAGSILRPLLRPLLRLPLGSRCRLRLLLLATPALSPRPSRTPYRHISEKRGKNTKTQKHKKGSTHPSPEKKRTDGSVVTHPHSTARLLRPLPPLNR